MQLPQDVNNDNDVVVFVDNRDMIDVDVQIIKYKSKTLENIQGG